MNTIHIIMDTLKRNWLGAYGCDWIKTPNLDRFAQKSVVFDQAYCASFPCMPARRDFLTGNYEFPFRGWGPLEETDITLPRLLSSAGVTTGLVTDHYHLFRPGAGNYHFDYDCWRSIRGIEGDRCYSDPAEGLNIDYQCSPERRHPVFEKYYYKFKHFEMKSEEDWHAARTFRESADWVRRNKTHKDGFHLQVDCFPPHEPFDPPPGYAEMYDPDFTGDRIIAPEYDVWPKHYSERELKNIRALYAGNITFVDKCFGEFMDRLEEFGVMDDTLIMVSTDHGTYTGDHGWTGKLGTYMYDCVAHIPLMIRMPGVPPRREAAIVQNVDLVSTLAAAAGVPCPATHGKSLLPLLKGEVSRVRNYAHSGFFGKTHIVNDGRYAFHLFHDQSRPLYWYGLHNSYFVGAGPLGPVEDGCRRMVDTATEYAGGVRNYYEPPALFDLQNDPEQKENLFESSPEIVGRFAAEIKRFLAEIDAPEEYAARLFE